MQIKIIYENKKQFIDLLLLADEQEYMIDTYLERGTMFVLYEKDCAKSICVVTEEKEGFCEIKNMATYPHCQRKGYGKKLLNYIFDYYSKKYTTIFVGTGESPLTIPFYESCGFKISHRIKNFFVDNYDHIIIEEGIQLVDMIYLKKDLI